MEVSVVAFLESGQLLAFLLLCCRRAVLVSLSTCVPVPLQHLRLSRLAAHASCHVTEESSCTVPRVLQLAPFIFDVSGSHPL